MARFCLLILLLAGVVLTPAQAATDSLQIPVCGWVDDLTAHQVPEPERRMLIAGYFTVTPAVFAEDQREAQWAMMEDVAREGQVLFGANNRTPQATTS